MKLLILIPFGFICAIGLVVALIFSVTLLFAPLALWVLQALNTCQYPSRESTVLIIFWTIFTYKFYQKILMK